MMLLLRHRHVFILFFMGPPGPFSTAKCSRSEAFVSHSSLFSGSVRVCRAANRAPHVRLILNGRYGGEASWAFAPTPSAQVLLAERCVNVAQQFGIHADGLQLGKFGQLEPFAADAAIIHSLGLVHGADVSEHIPSCKPSGPFHEAAYTSKKGAILWVGGREGRADEDALLQKVENRLPPVSHRVSHLVQIFHDNLGLLVDHSDGICQVRVLDPIEFLQELGVRFALHQWHV
jgi:hypothetical protein